MADRFRKRRREDSGLLEWPDCPIDKWKDLPFEVSATLTLAWEGPSVSATFFKDNAPTSFYEAFQRFKYNNDILLFPLGFLIWSPLISLNFSSYITSSVEGKFKPTYSQAESVQNDDTGLLFSLLISESEAKELSCGGNTSDEAQETWKALKKYYDEIPKP
ncbi:MAG TPA: hypothetical protein DCP55_07480 [Chitinophagaceae bacterium]|nr:hypothetical protein [Pseudomonadota bacterium]HAL95751.1 hypothetical protein [Chitinophagaceae bacterium]